MKILVAKNWLRFSILNLLIVAVIGVLMRYKIAYSFPYLDQKHLQHGHSHFAFTGWVIHTLYVLMALFLQRTSSCFNYKKYRFLIMANLLTAYGMLFSFPVQGYGPVSIGFSFLSTLVGFVFAYQYIKDLKTVEKANPAKKWYKAALIFNVVSSLGTFALAYMMATKNLHQNWYLASLYYYLHFQYNGLFFFACMGLITGRMYRMGILHKNYDVVFWMFAIACVPAYFLSALWMDIPVIVYALVVIAAIVQVWAWIKFLLILKNQYGILKPVLSKGSRWLFLLVIISLSIKLLLQLGSTIPEVSKLAFGFRNIVIAYLHLELLAIITLFLLTYMFSFTLRDVGKKALTALWIFTAGIFMNEAVLGVVGVASFTYTAVPYSNEMLLGISAIMLLGLVILLVRFSGKQETHG
ncbi:MAG: hypothetical protein WAT19_06235 [Ferruginibacter sp.]